MKNHQTVGKRKVVFYGRVSTEHEEQTYALGNQMQWYEELKKNYPNWIIIERYVDDGITGTQAKKRPEFMRMIDDAKIGKFDLIVTREVARFARNTVECLEITRQLKNYGVEVFFVQDGIWTTESEGEMILTIRAMVAQEESRKMSERIKAGQAISRKNGVLYGNGNLLGYNRIGDTYVINQEQAETVRMIFDLYESGLGVQAIRNELIKRERKNSSGLIKWDSTRILRCLKNTIYKGVMAYNKSHRNNYLEQKGESNVRVFRIRNNDEVPDYFTASEEEQDCNQSSTSGIYKFGGVLYSVTERPNDITYWTSYTSSHIENSSQYFKEKTLVEYFPVRLCDSDDPALLVNYLDELRKLSPQYNNRATNAPLPLHYLNLITEYFNY